MAQLGGAETAFNIESVVELFAASLRGSEDDVELDSYIRAYRELNKLFGVLGIIFKFVEKDVADKEGILANLIEKDVDAYRTVASMISHEVEAPGMPPKELGSRTLLRLHRALEFVILFVRKMHEMAPDDSVSQVCRSCYEKTLAHHHGWLIRQSVSVASRTLPTREYLIKEIFSHHEDGVSQEAIDKHAAEFDDVAQKMSEDAFVEECSLGLQIDRIPIVFDERSKRAFVSSNNFVLVFNPKSGVRENVFRHDSRVAGTFYRDGKLITLTVVGECCVWESATDKLLFCKQLEFSSVAFVYSLERTEEDGDCVYILGVKEGDQAERVFRCYSDLSVEDSEVVLKDVITLSTPVKNHRSVAFGKDFVVVCNGKFVEMLPLSGSSKSASRYELKQQFERVVDNSQVVWDGVSVTGNSVSATLSIGRVYMWRRVNEKGLTAKNSSFIHPGQTEIVHSLSKQHTIFCGTGECTVSKWSSTTEGSGLANLGLSSDECVLAVVLENTALLFVKSSTMTILSSAEQLLWPKENLLSIKCDPLRLDTVVSNARPGVIQWLNPAQWKTVATIDVCQANVPNRNHTLYNEYSTWSDVYLTCVTTQMVVTVEKQNSRDQNSLLKFWRRVVSQENEVDVFETHLEDSVDFDERSLVSIRGDEDCNAKNFFCEFKPLHSQRHTDQVFITLDDAGYFYVLKGDSERFGGWCVDHVNKFNWQSSKVIHSSSLRSDIFASVHCLPGAVESTYLLLWNLKNEAPKMEYIEDSIVNLRSVEWAPSGNETTFRYLLYASEQLVGSYDVEALCTVWTVACPGSTLFVSPTICIAGKASDYCSFDPGNGQKSSQASFLSQQEVVLSTGDVKHFHFVGYSSSGITLLKNSSDAPEIKTKPSAKKTPFSELLEVTHKKNPETEEVFALEAYVANKLFDGPAHALAPVTQLAPLFIRSCLIK
ncbi:hypothetical protein QR680_009596 [Steinernema hermaphroditum]|uniref:Glycolipid transfer protein domain-containing protein n=1 Tax=Steinernema hermaphroditum TaxID=289476 RepID=A0AA39IMB0_9BILA|nr:hypothetical protein QR680_009596 [Steinernema hermaphroditum]